MRGILALLLMPALADGQEGLQVSAGFKFGPGGYYGPPYQKQLKSLLTGTKAQQQPGGLYLITDGKFETFLENGQREMLVEAPQCLYDERGDHSIRSTGPLRVGGGIKPPRKIKDVKPAYPPGVLAEQMRGTVVIEATIDTDGKVCSAKILHSVPALDQAALDAVRQWEYAPSLLDGLPVAVVFTVIVNFVIQ